MIELGQTDSETIGILYNPETKKVTRIIIPDDDFELYDPTLLCSFERLIIKKKYTLRQIRCVNDISIIVTEIEKTL